MRGARSWALRAVMCWDYLAQHHVPDTPIAFDPEYDEAAAAAALEASSVMLPASRMY